ncbi:MAG: hypothetical protein Q7T55_15765 [Solirubrobacteraceae bacterium]|nr:hypothetical protein [Solirubrobacteraceae bacterium]
MRRVLLTSALVLSTGVAACGAGPTPEPSVGRPALDPSGEPFAFPTGGSIDMPASWTITAGPAGGPEVVRATSGQGAITVWRYPRTEPLPVTRRDLRNTRRSLRAAVKARDPDFKFTSALLRRLPEPGIEIAGVAKIAGANRSVRSLHVYANATETVVDCIGPLGDAAAYTETICGPVIRSLKLS